MWIKMTPRRRNQCRLFTNRRELQLLHLNCDVAPLLRCFSGGDGLTDRTRVIPVESLSHGLSKRIASEIVAQHSRPGIRLKHSPMRAHRGEHGRNHQQIAESVEHEGKLDPNGGIASEGVRYCGEVAKTIGVGSCILWHWEAGRILPDSPTRQKIRSLLENRNN